MFFKRKCVALLIVSFFSLSMFCSEDVLDENLQKTSEQEVAASSEYVYKPISFDNIFFEGTFQRYIAVLGLEDYTMPKPGWNLGLGFDFFRGYSHSFQILFNTGYNVVSGSNPLIRMLDILPITGGLSYSFSPKHRCWQWLSLGVTFGGGVYYSEISHYQTVLDLINQKLTTSNGSSYMFYGRLNFGINFLENILKLRINAGIDCISEIDGIIPIPVVEVGLRLYPVPAFKYIVRKPKPEIVYVDVPVEVEKIVEVEKPSIQDDILYQEDLEKIYTEINSLRSEIISLKENEFADSETIQEYKKGNLINIYFMVNSDELSKESALALIEIGKYLEEYSDEKVLIQGHSAPFETEKLQYQMGLNRANIVRNYLIENFNIANKRVKVESLGASQAGKIVPGKTNEDYKEHRMAQIKSLAQEELRYE